jgi:NADP-dependent 3-hydroxy acid dehydrogenase YdfG
MSDGKKIAWVTGAGSGIGKGTALALAAENYTVIASSRGMEALDSLSKEASMLPGSVVAMPCDVTLDDQVAATHTNIVAEYGPVDVLVNSAGSSVFHSFMKSDVNDFDRLYQTNLRGSFICSQAVLPSMIERNAGVVVMINSMAAKEVFANSSIYSATKAGLRSLADGMRLELREKNIKIVSVYPGATATAIWPDGVVEKHAARMMKPEEVGKTIVHTIALPPEMVVEDIYLQPTGGPL